MKAADYLFFFVVIPVSLFLLAVSPLMQELLDKAVIKAMIGVSR